MRRTAFAIACSVIFAAAPPLNAAQDSSPTPLFKSEKKLVLVDVVVTDKKGGYVHGLTAKDFKLWEDKDEQTIETFAAETDPNSPLAGRNHYLVLFFDNSTMDFAQQTQARDAAAKFIDKNASPNKLMAIVNFGGSLQITQNFTSDADRLKKVVSGVKFSAVAPNGDAAGTALSNAAMNFGARNVLLALRSLAKSLGTVPGRKTLIFLSGGFRLNSELRSELTAVIDTCNKNNVAIYPIDARGLVPGGKSATDGYNRPGPLQGAFLVNAAYLQQKGGGGTSGSSGGTGGARPGGGGGGGSKPGGTTTTGGSTGTSSVPRPTSSFNNSNSPYNRPRSIMPAIPDVTGPQDVLYALASGTGGFVILNTNDLLGGLDRIGNELNEYYILGYSPAGDSESGACHELKVKVNQSGVNVRSRTGYCATKPVDLLAGSLKGKELEGRASAASAGNVAAKMQSAFFYTAANTARVDVAMEIPADTLKFKKDKGKMHSDMSVLGVAYTPDGGVAARFSDTLKMEFENKKEVEAFQEKPIDYEAQFDIAPGKYNLKVVFSTGGDDYGKLELPLQIEKHDPAKFGMSAVAMSRNMRKVTEMDASLDATLLAEKTPLIASGMQITPTASNVFSKEGPGAFYLEVYEPALMDAKPHKVGLVMVVVDKKTNETKFNTGLIDLGQYAHEGNPVIPVGLRVPSKELAPGSYRAQFQAGDEAGNKSTIRVADFEVQP